jgi:hypothetical protein
VNTEERKLADVLHRVTPEPPRPVTVEQVAYRLVSEPQLGRQTRGREPRPRRGGLSLSRAFAPVMAAAAVVVIAGASAGIAVLANSHHNPPPVAAGGPSSSSSVSSASTSSSPSPTSSPTEHINPGTTIAGGPWGAALIDQETLDQESLISGDGSLYAYSSGYLDRIDPATGAIVATAHYNPPLPSPPVIVGNTVWVVWSASGGNVVLHGYDAHTLRQTAAVQVPATGPVAASASNVLTAGPDGHLYVAAGLTVAVVDPATGNLIKRINLTQGSAASVAVSPDGSTLYVGVSPSSASSGGFELLVYNLASDTVAASSALRGSAAGGTLVATSGGVWGTTGVGMSEWTWFAPGGDLGRAVRIGQGAGAGFASVPSYSGGVVWVGGSHTLTCASPANGRILDTATLPTDHSVVEYFSSPAMVAGHAYSIYQDNAAQRSGVVRMTPPAACSVNISS